MWEVRCQRVVNSPKLDLSRYLLGSIFSAPEYGYTAKKWSWSDGYLDKMLKSLNLTTIKLESWLGWLKYSCIWDAPNV